MGDPAMYPEIRAARSVYALQRLPRDFTADVQARKQWVDNNLTYLDGLVIADLHYHDADFRRDSWSTYHNLHMCRLGVCPQWLWSLDVYGLSTVTEIELLAALESIRNWRPYLWGRRFKLVIDHAALRWLHTMKDQVSGGPAPSGATGGPPLGENAGSLAMTKDDGLT
eukprot:scaffold1303_cov113-Isochrysis_galbana.AAC.3